MKHIKAFIFPLVIICVVVVYIFGVPYLRKKAAFKTRIDRSYSSVGKNYLVKKLPYYSRGDKELFTRATGSRTTEMHFPNLQSNKNRQSTLLKLREATNYQLNDNALLKVSLGTFTSSNSNNPTVTGLSLPMDAQNYGIKTVDNQVNGVHQMFANAIDEDQIPMAKSFPGGFPDDPGAPTPLGDIFFPMSLLLGAYLVLKKRL